MVYEDQEDSADRTDPCKSFKNNVLGSVCLQIAVLILLQMFVVFVAAVVCPELVPLPNSWVERQGDRIIARCHFSTETQGHMIFQGISSVSATACVRAVEIGMV